MPVFPSGPICTAYYFFFFSFDISISCSTYRLRIPLLGRVGNADSGRKIITDVEEYLCSKTYIAKLFNRKKWFKFAIRGND